MTWLVPTAGKEFRLSVAPTVGGTYTLVKGMNAATKENSRSTESTSSFDTTNAFTQVGAREVTAAVDGLLIPDDPGQILVRGYEAGDTLFYAKFLPKGGSADATENVRGFTWAVKVGTTRSGYTTDGAATWGFDLVSQADEVITVGGYII